MDDEIPDLSLGYYRGPLDDVLAALHQARFQNAVLELGGDPSDELHAFADELTPDDPYLQEKNRRARYGTRRIGPLVLGVGPLYLPIREETFPRLLEMSDRHAEPEIAIHLRVLDPEGPLVDAPDVGDNEIWVSPRLPKESIEAIRAVLGDRLADPT